MRPDLDDQVEGATPAADLEKTQQKAKDTANSEPEPIVDPEAPEMRASHVGIRPVPPSSAAVEDGRPVTPTSDSKRKKEKEQDATRSEPRSGAMHRKVYISPSTPTNSSPRDGSKAPTSRNARERKKLREKNLQLAEAHDRLVDKNKNLVHDNKKLAEENLQLKDKNKDLTSANKKLADQIKDLEDGNKAIQEDYRLLEQSQLELEQKKQFEMAQLLNQVQDLEDELEDKVAPLTESNRQLARQAIALKAELKEKEEKLKNYKVMVEQKDQDWGADRTELENLKKSAEMLKNLQQEVLAGVDRHEPTFDEKIHSRFITVNGKINSAVRSVGKGLTLFSMFASTPFDTWTRNAIPLFCYNSRSSLVSVKDKKTIKLLMRLAIWNFIAIMLFDRRRPFAVYGSSMALRLTEEYMEMFSEDYKTSETAAKWRAMTARRLAELDNKGYQDRVLNDLIATFARMVHTEIGYKERSASEIEDLLQGEMLPKIEPVLRSAMDLAHIVSQERAGYTLVIPDLQKLQYEKIEEDEYFTNRARLSNIDVAGSDEEELGTVALVASPMLFKWGSGSGEQLTHKTVLEKAFVLVEPAPQ